MSLDMNKNNSRIDLSIPFIDTFKQGLKSKLCSHIPMMKNILSNLCQILDNNSLTELDIEQGTIDSILWNDQHSEPLAIDQNKYLIDLRRLIREYIHEFLEFSQQIRMIYDHNQQINNMIEHILKHLHTLKDYRTQRQYAYEFVLHNHKNDNPLLTLIDIDKQQYRQLRFAALNLQEYLSRLIRDFDY